MARRDDADLQGQVVDLDAARAAERRREVAASVNSGEVERLARSAPAPTAGQGRPPVHVAIDPELYRLFGDRLAAVGLTKRQVVEQLIAGWVADVER